METKKINLAEVSEVVIEDLRSKFLKASQIAESLEKEQSSNLAIFKDMRRKLAYIAQNMKSNAKPAQINTMMRYFKELPALQEKIAEVTRAEVNLMGELASVFGPDASQYFPRNKASEPKEDLRGYA